MPGRTEKRVHRRVMGRESDRSGMVCDFSDADGSRFLDQKTEDPASSRQSANVASLPGRDASRNELNQLSATSNHPERSIAGVGDLGSQVDYSLQHHRQREL